MKHTLLSVMRNRSASTAEFRRASDRIAPLLCEDTLSTLGIGEARADVMIVPILRAALALVPAFTAMMPDAPVGMIGVERDESTSLPRLYCEKLPRELPRRALILDPMLATGGSACLAAELLIDAGYEPDGIYFTGVLAAPEGLERLAGVIPRANITVGAVDLGLDAHNFIVPGLGDYGDRYYGTA